MIRIGLTLSIENRGSFNEYLIPSDYVKAVIESGALPVLIPPLEDRNRLDLILSGIDGIIITGGDDISPEIYGEENTGLSLNTSRVRDEVELYLMGKAVNSGNPVLGICRGFQLVNIFFGGTLYQDLESQFKGRINHKNNFRNSEDLHHEVIIESGSRLSSIIRSERFMVNSRHHQGVKEPGRGLVPSAYASDGIIEALEQRNLNIIAVQWHPENLVRLGGKYISLFADLVQRCKSFRGK